MSHQYDVERFDDLAERIRAHTRMTLLHRYARSNIAEEFAAAGARPEVIYMVADFTGKAHGLFANLDEVEGYVNAREREAPTDTLTIEFPALAALAAPFGIAIASKGPHSAKLFHKLDVDSSAKFIAANDTELLAAESSYARFVLALGKLIRRERVRRHRVTTKPEKQVPFALSDLCSP